MCFATIQWCYDLTLSYHVIIYNCDIVHDVVSHSPNMNIVSPSLKNKIPANSYGGWDGVMGQVEGQEGLFTCRHKSPIQENSSIHHGTDSRSHGLQDNSPLHFCCGVWW